MKGSEKAIAFGEEVAAGNGGWGGHDGTAYSSASPAGGFSSTGRILQVLVLSSKCSATMPESSWRITVSMRRPTDEWSVPSRVTNSSTTARSAAGDSSVGECAWSQYTRKHDL